MYHIFYVTSSRSAERRWNWIIFNGDVAIWTRSWDKWHRLFLENSSTVYSIVPAAEFIHVLLPLNQIRFPFHVHRLVSPGCDIAQPPFCRTTHFPPALTGSCAFHIRTQNCSAHQAHRFDFLLDLLSCCYWQNIELRPKATYIFMLICVFSVPNEDLKCAIASSERK